MIKILEYGKVENGEIFARENPASKVEKAVADIIDQVKRNGDQALFDYSLKFDGVSLESLVVSQEEIERAYALVEPEFIRILKTSAGNIRAFHEKQKRDGFEIKKENGVILGQKVIPIQNVGLYVPGGTAAYPSTVLMDSIPAKIAGCERVVMVTPPKKDGNIDPYILAAASVAGVDTIYKVGGAQAIAALAYGTQTIKPVDKIVGPGNAYVAEAKKQVFGKVAIDMIAGPSEIMIVADKKSDPSYVAADMLSQAEHDKMATAVLITDSKELSLAVKDELYKQLEKLERKDIALASIENNGKIIITEDLSQAVALANELAPEHLELVVDEPFELLKEVKNAGSVFLGRYCPEALGDYYAGPNHTLPTMGSAKFSNPLSVDDFVKKTQYAYYTKEALSQVANDVAYFANKEGLTAHAKSALIRK